MYSIDDIKFILETRTITSPRILLFLKTRILLNEHLPECIIKIIGSLLGDTPKLIKGFIKKNYKPFEILKYWQYCGNDLEINGEYISNYFNRYFSGINKRSRPFKNSECPCCQSLKNNFYIVNPDDKQGEIIVLGSQCIKNFWGSKIKKCKDCNTKISFSLKKNKTERKRCPSCFKKHKLTKKIKMEQKLIIKQKKFEESHCKICQISIDEIQRKYGGKCKICNLKALATYKYSCGICNKKLKKNYRFCYNCKSCK